MKTVISTDRGAAVELLRKGEPVALPTETVYGLAANALDSIAVAKIFEAKERPRFDPLIVHMPNRDWLERIVDVVAADRQLIGKLADKFWPGPFSMVLPKRDIIPDIVTAGLDTVAVRFSAHPVFAEIAGELNKPLAAPSADTSRPRTSISSPSCSSACSTSVRRCSPRSTRSLPATAGRSPRSSRSVAPRGAP